VAKKYIAPVVTDFVSFTLHDWGFGKDFQESVSKISGSARDPLARD
jgi:hypothetical protein